MSDNEEEKVLNSPEDSVQFDRILIRSRYQSLVSGGPRELCPVIFSQILSYPDLLFNAVVRYLYVVRFTHSTEHWQCVCFYHDCKHVVEVVLL